jgi:hypothetical protein
MFKIFPTLFGLFGDRQLLPLSSYKDYFEEKLHKNSQLNNVISFF